MHRATVGTVSTTKAFRQRDHSVRVITGRLERHANTEKLAVKTAPTKCTEQPWERSRPRRLSGRRIIRYGLSLRDLRRTDIEELAVKTAPTKCTGQPWERSRPRKVSRHKASPPHGALFEQMPASLRQAPLVAVPERSHGPPVTSSSHPPLGNRSRLGHLLRDPTPGCRASAQNKPEA